MRRLVLVLSMATSIAALISSCGNTGYQGQLVGDRTNSLYIPPTPYGMSYIPTGILHSGASDADVFNQYDAPARTVQINGFYMDNTEITNAEYRQFTNWIKDSIAHAVLGDFAYDDNGNQFIDWKIKINWKDEDVMSQIGPALFVPANQTVDGVTGIDAGKIVYNYSNFDYNAAVKDPNRPKTDFVKKYSVPVYPDTTVWVKMFSYSYNDPIATQYYNSRTFDDYPVVGVSYSQAEAFCNWRTGFWNAARVKSKIGKLEKTANFKLPSEEQWEWAARGGRKQSPYPWGGPYPINQKGCYMMNFKPQRGNYAADGGLYTVKVTAYNPNDYGLYNMAGNVSEWTKSTYFNNSSNTEDDMNPQIRYEIKESDPLWMRRKVIRGGSWKDVAYYCQVSTRDYEFADSSKAYIGFRCIIEMIEPALFNKKRTK